MESNNKANYSELLIKLTRLEDQVAALSSQLESNKLTISQLKLELSERDAQIQDLESKLIIAQNSLQKTAIAKIHHCREQIKYGIDAKILTPVLTQIQKYIDNIEGLIAETKDLINKKKAQLNDGFNATSVLVRQSPEQVKVYLEKKVIEPASALAEKIALLTQQSQHESREWLERELVCRYKALSERIAFASREIPLNTKIIFQTRVSDPVMTYVDDLPELIHGLTEKNIVTLRQTLDKIPQRLQEFVDFIMEFIKKSSFWDGKQRMQTAA